MTYLLGAKRPDPHVLKTFPRLEAHIDRSVLTDIPPNWHDQDPDGSRYPMDGNDIDGDCVAAWIAHAIESQARRVPIAGTEDEPTIQYVDNIVASDAVVNWYWEECDRQNGAPVPESPPGPGLDPTQATVDWAKLGFPTAAQNPLEGACSVGLNDAAFLRWCAWTFRGFGIAVELSGDWQTSFQAEGPWAVTQSPDPMNGHMMLVNGYDSEGQWQFATWGQLRWAVPRFVPTYGMYGIVVLPAGWQDIPGVNAATLEAELKGFGGTPIPL